MYSLKYSTALCGISGQQLNKQKSIFKVSPNTQTAERLQFKEILKMELVRNIGTHLRVSIHLSGKKHTNFQLIVDKVAGKISAWNSCNLSQSQELILINYINILIAMASHVLAVWRFLCQLRQNWIILLQDFFGPVKQAKVYIGLIGTFYNYLGVLAI